MVTDAEIQRAVEELAKPGDPSQEVLGIAGQALDELAGLRNLVRILNIRLGTIYAELEVRNFEQAMERIEVLSNLAASAPLSTGG